MKKCIFLLLGLALSVSTSVADNPDPSGVTSSPGQSAPNVSSPEGQVKLQPTAKVTCPEDCPPSGQNLQDGCYTAECINGKCEVTLVVPNPKWQPVPGNSCLETSRYCENGKWIVTEQPRNEGLICAEEIKSICQRVTFACVKGICAAETTFNPGTSCGTPRIESCRKITPQCTAHGTCDEKESLLAPGTSCGSPREQGCRILTSECADNGVCAEKSAVNPAASCGARQEEECRVIEPYCDTDGTCKNKDTVLEGKSCGKTDICWTSDSFCTAQGLCKESSRTYFPGKSCGERKEEVCAAREPVCSPTGECQERVTFSPTGTDCSRDKPANKCKKWTCDGAGGCKEESISQCCGNGIVESPEQCDHGGTPNNSCSEFCTIPFEKPGGSCDGLNLSCGQVKEMWTGGHPQTNPDCGFFPTGQGCEPSEDGTCRLLTSGYDLLCIFDCNNPEEKKVWYVCRPNGKLAHNGAECNCCPNGKVPSKCSDNQSICCSSDQQCLLDNSRPKCCPQGDSICENENGCCHTGNGSQHCSQGRCCDVGREFVDGTCCPTDKIVGNTCCGAHNGEPGYAQESACGGKACCKSLTEQCNPQGGVCCPKDAQLCGDGCCPADSTCVVRKGPAGEEYKDCCNNKTQFACGGRVCCPKDWSCGDSNGDGVSECIAPPPQCNEETEYLCDDRVCCKNEQWCQDPNSDGVSECVDPPPPTIPNPNPDAQGEEAGV